RNWACELLSKAERLRGSRSPVGKCPQYNLRMIILALLIALALQLSPNATDQTALLRAKDQALLDAFAPGNRKIWDEVLAADAIFVDESGTIMNRAEFLDQLRPLQPGASGNLEISSYLAHF